MPPEYLAAVLPGLEPVLVSEVRAKVPGAVPAEVLRGRVVLGLAADPQALLALRTADNIYRLLGRLRAGPHRTDLPDLQAQVAALPLAGLRPPEGGFHVNASRAGRHTYSRFAAAAAAAAGLEARGWRPGTPTQHELEFRLDVVGEAALFSVRLTPPAFRFRAADRAFTRAALRPTVAHGLVWLTAPGAGDRFLDPFCGSGTILAERLAYPAAAVRGGDIAAQAVEAAQRNAGGAGRAEVRQWDALRLPLDAASVTRVATNLPFGRQHGSPGEVEGLYRGFAAELRRVLAPGGLAVVLTDQGEALAAAAAAAGLRCRELLLLSLKGLHPRVHRLEP